MVDSYTFMLIVLPPKIEQPDMQASFIISEKDIFFHFLNNIRNLPVGKQIFLLTKSGMGISEFFLNPLSKI